MTFKTPTKNEKRNQTNDKKNFYISSAMRQYSFRTCSFLFFFAEIFSFNVQVLILPTTVFTSIFLIRIQSASATPILTSAEISFF
jgi:hypothetical protein